MEKQFEIQSVLNTQSFLDEIKDMTKECYAEIENSNPEDVAIRERAYHRIKAIDSMMTRLQSVVDSDKIKDKSWTIL
jgi:hypothetical protein|tara:strand:- start:507 stop:737 length:231 start_codon:yes stop_codon:yes gene_type:complete